MTLQLERFGTRHRAALGITEQTDAFVVVVSEESAQISLVERARILRNLDEPKLARAIVTLLRPPGDGPLGLRRRGQRALLAGGRAPRLVDFGRVTRHRDAGRPRGPETRGQLDPAERRPDEEPPAASARVSR
jgi:hypothetical protein